MARALAIVGAAVALVVAPDASAAPAGVLRILAGHGVPTRTAATPTQGEQPRPCLAGELRTLVRRFVDEFDKGDLRALDRVLARKPDFRSYSTTAPGERLQARAYDRQSLLPYFARRHAVGERLELRSFRFTGNSADGLRSYGNFTFTLDRTTPELGAALYRGKGAAYCYRTRSDAIIVWSMAKAA